MTLFDDFAFGNLYEVLIGDLSVLELATLIIEHAAEVFGVSDAAIVTKSRSGDLLLLQATSGLAKQIESHQIRISEGPLVSCCTTGEIADVPDLGLASTIWPQFEVIARDLGANSFWSIPMRADGRVIGSLDLVSTRPHYLDSSDLASAVAFADIAVRSLAQAATANQVTTAETRLRQALASRIVIEQAKGVIAEKDHIGIAEAFVQLRQESRTRHRKLSEIAGEVVRRAVHDDRDI